MLTDWQSPQWGAFAFGLLIGWYVYYVNRYRREEIKLNDVVTLIGVLGGAAVLALFPAGSVLFGAYGVGLAAGFFAYFVVLVVLVGISKDFGVEWFLDGRRRAPTAPVGYPEQTREQMPMGSVSATIVPEPQPMSSSQPVQGAQNAMGGVTVTLNPPR